MLLLSKIRKFILQQLWLTYRKVLEMKNRFIVFNVLIAIALLFVLVISLIFTFSYQQPTDLKQQTGVVSKFNQYDEKWYDNIFGNTKGSYFDVRFEDDSYFEATSVMKILTEGCLKKYK